MTKKNENWENKLNEYIESVRLIPFRWGQHDCVTFVCGGILSMTGMDLFAGHDGTYRSKSGATRLVKKLAGPSACLVDAVNLYLPGVDVKLAQRGDVVIFASGLGLCYGLNSFFISDNNLQPGLVTVPTLSCPRAWRV